MVQILSIILLWLLMLPVSAEPVPFRAVYKADYKGLPVSAEGIRELKKVDPDTYLLSSSAKSFFASITEKSRFRLEGEQPVPLQYTYNRSGIGKNKQIDMAFDWDGNTVSDISRSDPWELDIPDGVMDKLLYQYKMRGDLQKYTDSESQSSSMSYQVADNGRLKTYDFKVMGKEEVQTPIGRIQTVKAIRVREDDDRMTTFWMATDYDYMLVRLLQVEKNGKGFELLLKEAQFDGSPVHGL